MIVKKLPGIENEQDSNKLVNNLFNAVYWSRRLGKNEAADRFDEMANILNDLILEPIN